MNRERIRRRTILTATAAALTSTLLPDRGWAGTTRAAGLQTIPIETAVGRSAAGAGPILLPARTTEPFSLLGITWADPFAALQATVQVRTRSRATRRWTNWRTLASHGSAPEDARGATEPLWTGDSDGVQARLYGGNLPDGLRLDLIDPGRSPAPTADLARRAVPVPARPVPRLITRAGWGADETLVRSAPAYTGPTEVFFVHHTATGNDYDCADSAAIVRGIQAYQVRSKGWDDIGYNFLVDKCGHIFEGRAGGVDRPVLGAHTLGFNTDASAIAVIGTYDSAIADARAGHRHRRRLQTRYVRQQPGRPRGAHQRRRQPVRAGRQGHA
jgi:hypothetical protein